MCVVWECGAGAPARQSPKLIQLLGTFDVGGCRIAEGHVLAGEGARATRVRESRSSPAQIKATLRKQRGLFRLCF
jgi:hypothetical protein